MAGLLRASFLALLVSGSVTAFAQQRPPLPKIIPTSQSVTTGRDTAIALDLEAHVHALRSIDPGDTDFKDLITLKRALSGVSVVGLGEGVHGDAMAYRAKIRLVKFLHEKLGFNVLVWEAGLLDGHAVDHALQDSHQPIENAAKLLMDDTWATSPAARPIFEYARSTWKTAHPLRFAGMDGGRAHAVTIVEKFLSDLYSRVPALDGGSKETHDIVALATRTSPAHASQATPLAVDERNEQIKALSALMHRVDAHRGELVKAYGARDAAFVRHALSALQPDEKSESAHARYLETRDHVLGLRASELREQELGNNLLWLVRQYYCGEKVIIWAATAHLRRRSSHPQGAFTALPNETAGEVMSRSLGTGYYVLGITAGAGSFGQIQSCTGSLTPPTVNSEVGSLESHLGQLGFGASFIDLRHATPGSFLTKQFVSNAIGYLPRNVRWRESLDGIIYLPQSQPDSRCTSKR